MWWVVAGVALMLALPVTLAGLLVWLYVWLCRHYLDNVTRIFLEKPLQNFDVGKIACLEAFENGIRQRACESKRDDPRT